MTAHLEVEGLTKAFGEHRVLDHAAFAVAQGEVMALLGPSGSGKTTLLRLLAGFETPDAGRVWLGGDEVTHLPPARRGFGMVFQHYALFPHLDVAGNVAFGLEGRRHSRDEVARRVSEVLALVDLPGFEPRRVGELSGGQQQRVALARALAPEPRVLLLDEPLSNLDPGLRERTRGALRRLIERLGITTVLVTHEQREAFELGDRIAVLAAGVVQQVGTAEELYEQPANPFVADFVGRASFLAGRVTAPGEVLLEGVGGTARWSGEGADGEVVGRRVRLMLRPDSLAFVDETTSGAVPGEVVERRYGGAWSHFRVRLDGGAEVEVLAASGAARRGERCWVAPGAEGTPPRIFPGEEGW